MPTPSFKFVKERKIDCDSEAQAAEYAQANAHGRQALVYATEGCWSTTRRPYTKKNGVEQAFQIQAHGFKRSGPGLQRELSAPLPPGQTKTLAVNRRLGVYHLQCHWSS